MTNTQEATHPLDIELVSGMCDQARLAEQRRIIKVLEEHTHGDYRQVMLTPKLIAIIQGETKWFDHTS